MAKGIDTNTLIILGGMAALGFGAFYLMKREPSPAPTTNAVAATDAAARAANVTDPMIYQQMLGAMQQMMSKINSGGSKEQAQAELISTYVNMGVTGVTQILGAIGSFF